jgi:branched-chain amino acid transport system ATP-binding protein
MNKNVDKTIPVLEMQNVDKHFGGVHAIDNFSVQIKHGQIHGLIGPNGAGKTTIFNNITGIYVPEMGKIIFNGQDITGTPPHKVAQLGIGRTFQNIRLFANLPVLDNVIIAANKDATYGFMDAIFKTPKYKEREAALEEKAMGLLKVVGLADKTKELAGSLPYGHQRKLEIARAMALDPDLLLLDEPAAGMNTEESLDLVNFVREIRDTFDITILMIEHHMNLVMDISDRIYVLDFGKPIANGTPEQVQQNPVVIAAYLGVDEE